MAVTLAMSRLVLHCLALISHKPSARGRLRPGDGPSSRGSSSPLWNAPPAKGGELAANENRHDLHVFDQQFGFPDPTLVIDTFGKLTGRPGSGSAPRPDGSIR